MKDQIGAYLDDYTSLDQAGVLAQLTDMVRIYPWFTLGRYMELRSLRNVDTAVYNRAARHLDVRLFIHPYPRILLEEENPEPFVTQIQNKSSYQISPENTYVAENPYATENYYTEPAQWQNTDDIIDGFLNRDSTGRITPPPLSSFRTGYDDYEPEDISEESVRENMQIASETLANIYIAQGHPEKAIEIYYTLSLKYPEKSVFFANLIADVQMQYSNWQTTDY